MKTTLGLIFAALSVASAADSKTAALHPYHCFELTSMALNAPVQTMEPFTDTNMKLVQKQSFSVKWRNKCASTIKRAIVYVKFFNAEYERIGVAQFVAEYVAPGERLNSRFAVPDHLVGRAKHVAIQRIAAEESE